MKSPSLLSETEVREHSDGPVDQSHHDAELRREELRPAEVHCYYVKEDLYKQIVAGMENRASPKAT